MNLPNIQPSQYFDYAEQELLMAIGNLEQMSVISQVSVSSRARGIVRNAYYAAYHLTCAALFLTGVEPKSHEGAQSMLAMHLVKPGHIGGRSSKILNNLMNERHVADYKGNIPITDQDVQDLLHQSQPLIQDLVRFAMGRYRNEPAQTLSVLEQDALADAGVTWNSIAQSIVSNASQTARLGKTP